MKILITGAAGFLGAAAVKRALGAGHDVRAMIRQGSPRGRVELPDDKIVVADMGDREGLARAVAGGIEAVIHCAATTSQSAPDEALSRKVNVEGTRALYEAARAAGVKRWIQISSMSAHPGSTTVYGRTKLAADEYLRAQTGLPAWTILRPSLIYGPGSRGLVAKTVQLLQKLPVVPMIGPGRELIRPVYVDDVAEAALAALRNDATIGKTYMIGGADEIELNVFMKELVKARGLKRPLFHLPVPLALVMARAMSVVLKNPPITPDNVLGVSEAVRVEQAAAEKDLAGWKPMGLEEGLKKTFE
ncbi:NAD-dependent epimerase/dehydratase family protein [bacterium]|nr:NAD-dependent epimerase/dehydratase family protein [bacterium]